MPKNEQPLEFSEHQRREAEAAYDRLCKAMEGVQCKQCPTCGGSGINPDYYPEKGPADKEHQHAEE